MGSDSLLWRDGLFLRPHHFQSIQRQSQEQLRLAETWSTPYFYGLHRLSIDQDALANWRVSLSECHVRLRDGTQFRFPQDAHLSPVDIPRSLFRTAETRVRVYVGVAELRRGVSNVSGKVGEATRYVSHIEEMEDENVAGNQQEIEVRKVNPQILIGDEAARGYDAVPIMQLQLGATAEAPPRIDDDYIPPVLTKDAWTGLEVFVRSVYDHLGATAEKFSRQMIDRGVAFESGHREDLERILHLHAMNTALGGLAWIPFAPGIHPFYIYRELCRAVGALAIFRKTRRIPELPLYDHDNIAPCFARLKQLLSVETEQPADYVKVPFASEGYQMTVRLRPDWLGSTWAFYIGVESTLNPARMTEMLTNERDLGVKAGSAEAVDRIYTRGQRGVRIMPVGDPPRAFPRKDWHYFRVDREGAWESVESSLNFGIRFNDRRIEQQVAGENKVDVVDRESGNLVTLAFSLFAINST
ncbi:MAG: type VI secretion system baseplate subunit TssK [Planctomycetaceae bacterium]|nr:type VI secretion system baseplate subunit TssK [Planctomycetaceae bacterium]